VNMSLLVSDSLPLKRMRIPLKVGVSQTLGEGGGSATLQSGTPSPL
jgi:hypothetical protein